MLRFSADTRKDQGRLPMRTLFSTEGLDEKVRFQRFREFIHDRIGPVEQTYVGDGPFDGQIQVADVGGMRVTRISESSVQTRATPGSLRRRDEPGALFALVKVAGRSTMQQDGREAMQRAGDIVVLGGRPNVHVAGRSDQSFVIELPRARLEDMLGSSRLYTALTIEADRPATSLVTNFLNDLVGLRDRLDPDTAGRMASIGMDLLVAGIAERLAREVPESLSGTVVVQRAKAHVAAHLGDPGLDPPRLAAAVGVSLRRLQELFRARDRHIADWIWQRRLEAAAQRLADPATRHLPIASVAYGCGFASPAHFSRRFKERYGMTPRDYREASLRPGA